MNDMQRKFYARHLAAVDKEKPTDIQHWKYVSRERGPDGKWRYKYKESSKANKLTGKTDHEYTMSRTSDESFIAGQTRTPSYKIDDETTGIRFTYDADTKECKFEFATYNEDKNAKYSVQKGDYSNGEFVDKHVYEYTHDGKQYKTTVTVSAKDGTPHKMETRDLTSDTVVEKAIDKIKSLFKKK